MGGKSLLFNRIAAVYGLFFDQQVRNYRNIFDNVRTEFDLRDYSTVVDIGCGTGALCRVLRQNCPEVTGLDPAEAMLRIAIKKAGKTEPGSPGTRFIRGDVLEGLPFPDKSFDMAISSYVAHGLLPQERSRLYEEMSRVARHAAVLFDYNEQRAWASDLVEWLEGGDYFNFITAVRDELTAQFGELRVIDTGPRSALYICRIG